MRFGLEARVKPELDERKARKEASKLEERIQESVEDLEAKFDFDDMQSRLEDVKAHTSDLSDLTEESGANVAQMVESLEDVNMDLIQPDRDVPQPRTGGGPEVTRSLEGFDITTLMDTLRETSQDEVDSQERITSRISELAQGQGLGRGRAGQAGETLGELSDKMGDVGERVSSVGGKVGAVGGLLARGAAAVGVAGLGLIALTSIWGHVKKLSKHSPLLGQVFEILSLAMRLAFMPIAHILGELLLPIVVGILDVMGTWTSTFFETGSLLEATVAAIGRLGDYLLTLPGILGILGTIAGTLIGWFAGKSIGAAIGAAIGGIIGSFVGPVGTAAGAKIGAVAGGAIAAVIGGLTGGILGKSLGDWLRGSGFVEPLENLLGTIVEMFVLPFKDVIGPLGVVLGPLLPFALLGLVFYDWAMSKWDEWFGEDGLFGDDGITGTLEEWVEGIDWLDVASVIFPSIGAARLLKWVWDSVGAESLVDWVFDNFSWEHLIGLIFPPLGAWMLLDWMVETVTGKSILEHVFGAVDTITDWLPEIDWDGLPDIEWGGFPEIKWPGWPDALDDFPGWPDLKGLWPGWPDINLPSVEDILGKVDAVDAATVVAAISWPFIGGLLLIDEIFERVTGESILDHVFQAGQSLLDWLPEFSWPNIDLPEWPSVGEILDILPSIDPKDVVLAIGWPIIGPALLLKNTFQIVKADKIVEWVFGRVSDVGEVGRDAAEAGGDAFGWIKDQGEAAFGMFQNQAQETTSDITEHVFPILETPDVVEQMFATESDGETRLWEWLADPGHDFWSWLEEDKSELWSWLTEGESSDLWDWLTEGESSNLWGWLISGVTPNLWSWVTSGSNSNLWGWLTSGESSNLWSWLSSSSIPNLWNWVTGGSTPDLWSWITRRASTPRISDLFEPVNIRELITGTLSGGGGGGWSLFGGDGGGGDTGGGIDFIPGLAKGGVVTGPTTALVGEGSESEAVMPLSKLESYVDVHSGVSAEAFSRLEAKLQSFEAPSPSAPSPTFDINLSNITGRRGTTGRQQDISEMDESTLAQEIARELGSDLQNIETAIDDLARRIRRSGMNEDITITADGKVLAEVSEQGLNQHERVREVNR